MFRPVSAVLALALIAGCGSSAGPAPPASEYPGMPTPSRQEMRQAREAYATFRAGYLDWYHEAHPVRATHLGVHTFDGRMPAMNRAGIQRRIDDLLGWVQQLDEIRPLLLEVEERFDHQILEFAIKSELLELEEIRSWANDPRVYTRAVADGIFVLVEGEFAPVDQRVAAITSRLQAVPALLDAARTNLRTPPRPWTDLAVQHAHQIRAYLQATLPTTLAAQGADLEESGFQAALAHAVDEMDRYGAWLEGALAARSDGDFRLGRYLFQRKLLYEEHVNLTFEELDRINEQAIAEYREWADRLAAEIDHGRPAAVIMDSLPTIAGPELLGAIRGLVDEADAWVQRTGVVTVPGTRKPVVRKAPEFAPVDLAELHGPGPYDPVLPSYLYVRPGEVPAAELAPLVLHQTFPGHFVHLLYRRDLPSDVRRTFPVRSLVEGWAHYSEQLALDEGFQDGDPVVRLAQVQRALFRHARWFAGLHLHAFGRSVEDVVPRFMEISGLPEDVARAEVVRATHDPTHLYEAMGRMQILRLRDDYRTYLEGEKKRFSLREFHDTILALGLPLTLARDALIPQIERIEGHRPIRR